MELVIYQLFLLIFPLYSLDNVKIIEQPPFRYVYMDFSEPYDKIFEKLPIFQDEFQKQRLQFKTLREFYIIFLHDHPPIWRLAIPLAQEAPVQPPLQSAQMDAMSLVKNSRILNTVQDARMAIARTVYKAEEMGLRINDPTFLKWSDNSVPVLNASNIVEILLPIREIGTLESAVIAIYRFVISTASFLYLFFIVFLLSQEKKRTGNTLLTQ